jgi:hypothetical protein
MKPADRMRLVELRQKSKTGKSLNAWELEFCERMWKEHPEEYREVEKEIIEWAKKLMNPFIS